MTGFKLLPNPQFGNFWHYISNEKELDIVEQWEKSQGARVFLRDCLPLSIALSEYSTDPAEKKLTRVGQLESSAKYQRNQDALDELAKLSAETISSLPYYCDAPIVCAVAARSDKEFDLPKEIAKRVAKATDKKNASDSFVINGDKPSLKHLPLQEKWVALEKANIVFNDDLQKKNIILIDDLYQSGTTMQFMAMKLYEAGAKNVFGFCLVKGMRDTDNK
jgi:hypothetical protein